MIGTSRQTLLTAAALGAAWGLLLPVPLDSQPDSKRPVFEADIAPIFTTNCTVCHGGARPQADLDLTTLQSVLKGGKSGRAVVPGSPERSLLVEKIASGIMPPSKNKLDEKTVTTIRRWIEAGANSESAGSSPKTLTAEVFTENDVLPIFQMRCVLCHGKRRQEGGLDLRTQAARIKGGKSGPALIPGNPDQSLLMKRIVAGEMPPGKMLFEYAVRPPDSSEVETLRKWIAGGCSPAPEERTVADNAADPLVSDEARKFWSFQPPQRPPVPKVQHEDRVRNSIDTFLLQKLETKGLTFSAEADRLQLMRRAYLDVTGIPPSPAEISNYLADTRPDAYERLIDKLLGSMHYGERWGLYWLNAAGYSDSEGIIDEDLVRPQAWRYRDYVIRAFNQDKPYDRFLMEQIAGDELVDYKRAKQVTPELLDKLTATGFLRMAPDGTYSPSNSSVPERMNLIADEVEVLSSAVLGLTMGCARCHNHKYDPIPQRDYYRFSAILMTAYDPYDWLIPASANPYKLKYGTRHIDLALDSEQQEVVRFNAPLDQEQKKLEEALEVAAKPLRERLLQERLAALPQGVRDDLQKLASTPEEKLTEFQKYLADRFHETLNIPIDDLIKKYPEFKLEGEKLKKAIEDVKAKMRPKPQIRALFDMDGPPSANYLLRRGDVRMPGERVQPGVPSVLRTGLKPYQIDPPWPGSESSGRRLALARWLVQPNHPLTSRVIVNRIWMHHFGRGIVSSPANFGHTGVPPSHSELLDWLATEFVRQGWSMKTVHRLIMTSSAYRQTSLVDTKAQRVDPENILLSRMPLRRLDAETLYDSILAVTGRLDPTQFGPPAEVDIKPDGEVLPKGSKAGYRRSIYVLQRRVYPMTQVDVFDQPPMSPNCIERRQSTVPTQALQMMNGNTLRELSRYMAARLIDEFGEDTRQQIQQAYWRAYSRMPTDAEIHTSLDGFTALQKQWLSHLDQATPETPRLFTARWRALADFCRTLLSSAEFLYVD
jgi:mono/diheme cytochrome c family protein